MKYDYVSVSYGMKDVVMASMLDRRDIIQRVCQQWLQVYWSNSHRN